MPTPDTAENVPLLFRQSDLLLLSLALWRALATVEHKHVQQASERLPWFMYREQGHSKPLHLAWLSSAKVNLYHYLLNTTSSLWIIACDVTRSTVCPDDDINMSTVLWHKSCQSAVYFFPFEALVLQLSVSVSV